MNKIILTALMAISNAQDTPPVVNPNKETTIEALEGNLKLTYWTSVE